MIINIYKSKNDNESTVDFDYDIDKVKFTVKIEDIINNSNYYLIRATFLLC